MKKIIFILLFGAIFAISFYYFSIRMSNINSKIDNIEKALSEINTDLVEKPEYNTEQKYETLKNLSADVQISYFISLLGNAKYLNFSKDESRKEYIFTDDDFFVQAITDNNDKVLSYAVTSRSESFNPSIYISDSLVILYKTRFSDILKDVGPGTCISLHGNTAPKYYFESYYLGNATRYQDYLVGINDSAFNRGVFFTSEVDKDNFVNCENVDSEWRKEHVPNTYVVLSMNSFPFDFPFGDQPGEFLYGPNRIQLQQN